MKLIIALCLVGVIAAAPPRYADIYVEEYEFHNLGIGDYFYKVKQSDGTSAQQSGHLKNVGSENQYLSVDGSYSWVGPDGVTYTITYTADEEGYKPEIEQGPGGAVPNHIATLLG